jgi:hypothetical protein
MAVPVVLSPETAYATKENYKFPGTQAQATAAETAAKNRIEDSLPNSITVTVPAGAIELST